MRIVHYFDYKSPYAYLVQQDTLALAKRPGVELVLVPYTLDIPSYLGSAEVDADNHIIREQRNAHQWRRVRYAYMDARREANRRGLTVRGPKKIFDSSLAHIAFLYVQQQTDPHDFHRTVYQRFWRRELDIENPAALANLITDLGLNAAAFMAYLHGEGRELHDSLRTEAEANGVFGVPSYWLNGQLYWGTERLERVHEQVDGAV